jgi:hypothetical protein
VAAAIADDPNIGSNGPSNARPRPPKAAANLAGKRDTLSWVPLAGLIASILV